MPLVKAPIKYEKVDYLCDNCGKDFYRPTGEMLTLQHVHKCAACNDTAFFYEKYPVFRFVDETLMPS